MKTKPLNLWPQSSWTPWTAWLGCVSSPRSSRDQLAPLDLLVMNSPESGDQTTATSTLTRALGVEGCTTGCRLALSAAKHISSRIRENELITNKKN